MSDPKEPTTPQGEIGAAEEQTANPDAVLEEESAEDELEEDEVIEEEDDNEEEDDDLDEEGEGDEVT